MSDPFGLELRNRRTVPLAAVPVESPDGFRGTVIEAVRRDAPRAPLSLSRPRRLSARRG